MIRFGRAICGDLVQAERREWWLSNGLGGYACGTISGSLTRRYHGLLVTPLDAALDRHLLFTRAEPTLEIDGKLYPLSCNRWQSGSIAPHGYVHIESFHLDGELPVWVYAVAGVRLEQRIFMEQGEAAVWVVFRLLDSPARYHNTPIQLHLRLLVNQRDHHGQMVSNGISPDVQLSDKRFLQVDYSDTTQLHIQLSSGELQIERNWIKHFFLIREHERGLPDWDNHLAIANARFTLNTLTIDSLSLNKGNWQGLRAGLSASNALNASSALQREQSYAFNFINDAGKKNSTLSPGNAPGWIKLLLANTRNFLFTRPLKDGGLGESVIAGYPWFGDWGRDTMIALPGLTLATGQLSVARRILDTWSGYVDQGMIPNRFPEVVTSKVPPEYNSVDASLWFILAWYAYLEAGGEEAALSRQFPVLEQIINAYRFGTRYQIHLDEDTGLLHIGEPGSQLTWMDARVDGVAATPRVGKPVEVNALWYNALRAMQTFCEKLALENRDYADLSERARCGFERYQRSEGGLFDVLDGPEGDDDSIRPNQIIALSLPWSVLNKGAAVKVLDEVHRHLYTSYGLRSLSPQDPDYCAVYRGSVVQRDFAYHNGPVWGWLLGHYAIAHYRVHQDVEAAFALLEPMADHLFDAGLGSISEIFDGDPPHTPRGAPSQAWSVATVLEAWKFIQSKSILNPIET